MLRSDSMVREALYQPRDGRQFILLRAAGVYLARR
jgi:hypothetical protein